MYGYLESNRQLLAVSVDFNFPAFPVRFDLDITNEINTSNRMIFSADF
jgi:hypothetical protein